MKKMDRRTFLKTGLSLAGSLGVTDLLAGEAPSHEHVEHVDESRRKQTGSPQNILLIVTDQQRYAQHWPRGLEDELQPSMVRLRKNGMSFTNAFTATCQCSPSRCSTFTGTYPTIHGVEETPPNPGLSPNQLNMCSMLSDYYKMAYKGKWHMTLPASYITSPNSSDIEANMVNGMIWSYYDSYYLDEFYKVKGWNPPDAGNTLSLVPFIGGGYPNNDARFTRGLDNFSDTKMLPGIGDSAIDFLDQYDPTNDKPFFLIVSLVNPHDIAVYPSENLEEWGFFQDEYKDLNVELPHNYSDNLRQKPLVHRMIKKVFDTENPFLDQNDPLYYVRFYAYLHKVVDAQISALLDKLEQKKLVDDTLIIRYADHGEMGLAHGMREKMYNAYEETIRIPMIVSNPTLFPEAKTSDALVSSIDLLPTLADWAGIADNIDFAGKHIHGFSLLPLLTEEKEAVRNSILFTFDDDYEVDHDKYPGRIRCIRNKDWKYSVYYTTKGTRKQYEMYNLSEDPLEMENLGKGNHGKNNRETKQEMHEELTELMDYYDATPQTVNKPL